MSEFDVCIVGAGPVGLTLALDQAKRRISTALVDKELQPGPWPKMERCNARSMEIYRRLGVHDEIRRRGQHEDGSMDVAIVSSLSDPPLAFLEYPTVAAMRGRISSTNDGTFPREPYQVVSQYTLEPILREAVARCAKVRTFLAVSSTAFPNRRIGSRSSVEVQRISGKSQRTISSVAMAGLAQSESNWAFHCRGAVESAGCTRSSSDRMTSSIVCRSRALGTIGLPTSIAARSSFKTTASILACIARFRQEPTLRRS